MMLKETTPPILIASGVRGDTRRYRTLHLYQQLRLAGVGCQLSHLVNPQFEAQFRSAAIVILHRAPFNAQIDRLLRDLHQRGGLAVYDTDDLIFDPDAFNWIDSPDFQDPVRARLYREDMVRYRQTMNACDAITVSTNYLMDRALSLNKPVWIHRNAYNLEMLAYSDQAYQTTTKNPEIVTVGYASGTPTHQKDFSLVLPALFQLFEKYHQVQLHVLGPLKLDRAWEPFLAKYGSRVTRKARVPWRELPSVMAQWDINLAPLVMDNPFTQSKSEIKYMEAGLVRVPTIASPTDAFQYAIRPGENGFLAESDAQWAEFLEVLLDKSKRDFIGVRAYDQVRINYSPEMRAGQLIALISEICQVTHREDLIGLCGLKPGGSALVSPDSTGLWLDPREDGHPSLVELGYYNLRHRSLLTLLQQIWIYFRRLLAPIFPYRARVKPTGL